MTEKEMVQDDGTWDFGSIPDVPGVVESLDFTPKDDIELVAGVPLEEEEGTKEGDDTPGATEDDDTTPSANKVMLDWMVEKLGVKYNEEEFEDSPEYVEQVLKANYDEKANALSDEKLESKLENLPEQIKSIVGYHKEGIEVDELIESEQRLSDYKSVTEKVLEEDKDLQKEVIMRFLVTEQGLSKEKAEAKFQKYSDSGEDFVLDEAKDALEGLTTSETKYNKALRVKAEEEKGQKEIKRAEGLKEFETKIMGIKEDELLKGMKINDEQKKAIFNGLTKPVGTDKLGRPLNILAKMQAEDPLFLAKLYHVAVNLKWDVSQYKSTETKVLGDIKRSLTPEAAKGTNNKTITDAALQKLRKAMAIEKRKNSIF